MWTRHACTPSRLYCCPSLSLPSPFSLSHTQTLCPVLYRADKHVNNGAEDARARVFKFSLNGRKRFLKVVYISCGVSSGSQVLINCQRLVTSPSPLRYVTCHLSVMHTPSAASSGKSRGLTYGGRQAKKNMGWEPAERYETFFFFFFFGMSICLSEVKMWREDMVDKSGSWQ